MDKRKLPRSKEVREKIARRTREAMKDVSIRKKISDACKKRVGEKNSFYGKTHSNETKKIMSEKKKNLFSNKDNHPMYGRNHSEESIEKMKLQNGRNHPSWNGGSNQFWHDMAYDLFGKNECEICSISNNDCVEKYNKRLSMHNTLDPKDYTVMENIAWQCLCSECHQKVEKGTI
jgi:hypothetical protein